MQSPFKKPLICWLASDSTVPEAVAYRARGHDEDDEAPDVNEVPVPCKLEICSSCDGKGGSSAYLGAFSGRRLQEAREDEEFWGDYMSGAYDRPCESCEGSGRVNVPDETRCSPELLKAIEEQDESDAEHRAEQRAEYLMEGGWREEGWFDA